MPAWFLSRRLIGQNNFPHFCLRQLQKLVVTRPYSCWFSLKYPSGRNLNAIRPRSQVYLWKAQKIDRSLCPLYPIPESGPVTRLLDNPALEEEGGLPSISQFLKSYSNTCVVAKSCYLLLNILAFCYSELGKVSIYLTWGRRHRLMWITPQAGRRIASVISSLTSRHPAYNH